MSSFNGGGAASGAASGAMMGAAAGPIGMGVGALAGGLMGGLGGGGSSGGVAPGIGGDDLSDSPITQGPATVANDGTFAPFAGTGNVGGPDNVAGLLAALTGGQSQVQGNVILSAEAKGVTDAAGSEAFLKISVAVGAIATVFLVFWTVEHKKG